LIPAALLLLTFGEVRADDRPDIIFVMADDLDLQAMEHLDGLESLMADEGVTFTQAVVSSPLCCPSRATTLTGLYMHNTGVINNQPEGAFEVFRGDMEKRTIAMALQDAGYRTGLFGKYMNGYAPRTCRRYVPPGWTEWVATTSAGRGDPYDQYNYTLNENRKQVVYGEAPRDYMVDVLARKVAAFLRESGDTPAFAFVTPVSPHMPATAAPRHEGAFAGVQAPRNPNFNEADMSDKPEFRQNRKVLNKRAVAQIDERHAQRLASMLAVEDLMRRVIEVQTERGRLDNTWLLFTSDSGFNQGDHRVPRGKELPYEEDLRVPLYVRGPGVTPGSRCDALVVNTDTAPTLAAMAGVALPDEVDGRSWLDWVAGSPPDTWREAVLVQKGEGPPIGRDQLPRPTLAGIRTTRYKYMTYSNGQSELYDLATDPWELQNLAGRGLDVEAELGARIRALETCHGDACRRAEDPGYSSQATKDQSSP